MCRPRLLKEPHCLPVPLVECEVLPLLLLLTTRSGGTHRRGARAQRLAGLVLLTANHPNALVDPLVKPNKPRQLESQSPKPPGLFAAEPLVARLSSYLRIEKCNVSSQAPEEDAASSHGGRRRPRRRGPTSNRRSPSAESARASARAAEDGVGDIYAP